MYRKGLNKMTVMLMVVSVIASMFLTMGMPKSVYAEEDTINFAGGDGTLENPYKIATVENLRNVTIPSPGAYFQQVANFSLSGNWTPIGSFGGIYDGGGFAIENLTMNSSDLYIGLFSNLSSGAVLDNMRLENFSITATGDDSFVGGLVSFINAGATVANSISNGTISFTAPNNVGGLTGYNEGSISNSESNSLITSSGEVFSAGSLVGTNAGTISGSSGSGSIHSSDSRTAYLGGLVGTNAGTVRTSTSSSLVTGGDAASAGGLVGSNYSSSGIVNDSYSTGNASGKASAVVGGLIGRNTGDINRSYSTGNAHTGSDGMAGGLVGYKANGNIINSFSMGNVSGDGAVFVGGLVGMNNGGDVSYSYSTGGASGGSDSTGGLIGFNQGGTVSNSYFNNAGAATSPGEVFKSAEELKQQSTFSGWDFSTIWRIAEDYTYPSLQWQPYTADEITFIDHRDLTWDSIKGTNSVEDEVTSDLTLPTAGAAGSTITWSVSGGVGLIDTSTGRVTRATDDDHTVTLTATVSRSGGQTQMKDFSLKILEAPNNKPIRNSNVNGTANATVSVNTAYALNLSGIFEDVDGDPLSYKVSVDGAPTIAAAMTYTYTPISAGLVTLVFSASDEESDSDDTYTVSLTGNTVPVRQADVDATDDAAVTVNTPYTLDLATIFEDADSNPLSYNVSVNGAPTTTAAESYTYIPTTAGLVTLIFTANDTNVDSTDTYTVELSVNSLPVRKPNVGATTNAAVTVNTPFTLDLSTIFEDADSNTLTYKVSVDGAAEVTADTAYSYTPTATGLMTLVFKANDGNIDSTETYIINLTGNTVPVRQADVDATDDAVVMVNTPYALDLATIFEDADSNTLSYKVSVDGEAATTAAAAYTYTPTTAGLVTLVFTANDGSIDSTDTYTVELRVNSLPVRNSNVGATANASVTVNTPYSLDLSTIFEDVDSNTLSYKVSVDGEAAITAAAAYTYTPTTIGRVTLVFTANDGSIDSTDTYTVELSVNSLPVRKPNVGATANAAVTVNTPYALDLSTIFEDADSNTLSYKVSVDGEEAITASAAYTYTSTTAGLVTMVFTANDGNIDSTDTYTVELRVNSFPVRKPDVGATVNASIPVNTLYTLDLTTIFEDADGDLLSYKVAADGAPAIATSETYTYTLTTANTVALVFTANDTMVDSTETFTVNLKGNTVPVRKTDVEATADATVTVNTPFVLDLAEIFEDADGNPLTYNVSVNGTAAISAIPAYTYTPGAEGAMTLVFSANDGLADSTDTYTVKLTVSGSSYNNGNGGNGGGESIPMTPEYRVTITGSVGTTLPVEIDEAAGRASIAIGALAEKIFVDDGATVVAVPAIPGVKLYTLEVPAESLSNSNGAGELIFATDEGTIAIPADMLKGMTGTEGKTAGITIGPGDKTGLSAEAAAAVGGRPLVELTLALNGMQTSWNNSSAPVRISIPYTPTAEELKDPEHLVIWYIDGSGNVIAVPSGRYDAKSGTVTFAATHFSDYAVAYVKKTFSDLSSVEWARQSIEVMASKGIINGTKAGAYSPAARITRADYLVLLVKTLGLTAKFEGNFADVEPNAYYYEALGVAKQLGLAAGTGHDEFHPLENISRQDMMVLTARALEKAKQLKASGDPAILASFSDKGNISAYAKASLAALAEKGLISGSGNKLNPQTPTTRAEAAVFLYRIYNQY